MYGWSKVEDVDLRELECVRDMERPAVEEVKDVSMGRLDREKVCVRKAR